MATINLMQATSMVEKLLYSNQLTTTNATTLYTVPASSGLKLSAGSVCNTTASPVVVSLFVVPSGGTAGITNKIIHDYSLAAGDTISITDVLAGLMLGEGDFIAAQVGTANAVNITLSGAVAS